MRDSETNLGILIACVNARFPIRASYLFKEALNPENKGKSAGITLLSEMNGQLGILLVADFPQMNFFQMHERLRLELLRRIQRGTLSVSLLARQSGYGQSHLSNFLRNRRRLSPEALDHVLSCQDISLDELLPANINPADSPDPVESGKIPLVSHASALFERHIRPTVAKGTLHVPARLLQATRARPGGSRQPWQRFVAISISAEDAAPMDPILLPNAVLLLDRHYNSLHPYRPDRSNIYALSNGGKLALRYLDFQLDRLVLRPHNIAFPLDLLVVPPGETPFDMIAGRVVLALNEI